MSGKRDAAVGIVIGVRTGSTRNVIRFPIRESEVKNEWSYNSTPHVFLVCGQRGLKEHESLCID